MNTWTLIFTRFNLAMMYVCLGLSVFAFLMVVSDGNAFGWALVMALGAFAFFMMFKAMKTFRGDEPSEKFVFEEEGSQPSNPWG